MKYHINIDYSERSIQQDETAKLTLTDENNNKILNKVPISLPYELFDKKKTGFYYDINNVLPKVNKIDFKTNAFKDLFENNPSFKPLYELVDDNNFYETFNHDNDEYITYKRQVLFFPQHDNSPLGVDNSAFILHEGDFKKLTKALSQAEELTFDVKSTRFAIFNRNEKRELKKYSNINKAYTVLKEVLRHEQMANNSKSVQNKIDQEKRKIINKNKGIEETPVNIDNNTNLKIEVPNIKDFDLKNENRKKDLEHAALEKELRKNNTNDLSGLKSENKTQDKTFKQEDRLKKGSFDIMFMLALYNYFTLQKMSFNKEMIKNALPKIPGGENIKNFAFVSNEAGFFVSLYSDINKKDPVGALSFDYENKSFMLKNESSELTLSPSLDNERVLNLNAIYPDQNIDMKLLNFDNNKGNNIDNYYTLSQVNILNKENNMQESFSWAIKYNFDYQSDGFPIMSYKKNAKSEVIDINLIYDSEKENTGELINSKLTTLNFDFEGKNDELFKLNKEKVVSNINNNDLIIEDSTVNRDYYKNEVKQTSNQNKDEVNNQVVIDNVSDVSSVQKPLENTSSTIEEQKEEEENSQKIQLAVLAAYEKLKKQDQEDIAENNSSLKDIEDPTSNEKVETLSQEATIEPLTTPPKVEKEEVVIANPLLTALIQEKAKELSSQPNSEIEVSKNEEEKTISIFDKKQEIEETSFDPDAILQVEEKVLTTQPSSNSDIDIDKVDTIPLSDLDKLEKIEQENSNHFDLPVNVSNDNFSSNFSEHFFDEPQPNFNNLSIYEHQSYENSFPIDIENQYSNNQYQDNQYQDNQYQDDYQRMENERMENERQNREREELERLNNSNSGSSYRPF